MEVKVLVCPICGCQEMGKAKINGNVGVCPACDSSFLINVAEKLSKVEVDKTQDIKIFRDKLSSAVRLNDVVSILNYSKKILDIIPEDYSSKYYFAYAHNCLDNGQYLRFFYQDEIAEHTQEEIFQIIDHIGNYSDLRDDKAIIAYLARIEDIDNQSIIEEYKEKFEQRCRQEEYYDNVSRDVFICHRSVDSDKATKICEALEADGNTCWISTRNLRPNDSQNYWDNIEKAIENCAIFLVVCSRDAMLSRDVKREMEIAKRLNKPRLECKIDNSEHTTFFKVFFDGISWIDMHAITGKALSIVKQRVYRLLYPKEYTPIEEFVIDGTIITEYLGTRKNVVIPEGITEIGEDAFAQDKNLQSIQLCDALLKINSYAFGACYNLETIEFGDSLQEIGETAFWNCKKLKNVKFPRSLVKVGKESFEKCTQLESVDFGNILEIGERAFAECTNLKSILLPSSVLCLREHAFSDCSQLTTIKIENSSIYVEQNPFYKTAYEQNKSNWDNGALYLDGILLDVNGEVGDCYVIKNGTSSIAEYAFVQSEIYDVHIPNGVVCIGAYAFADSFNLHYINIPSSVSNIGVSALSSCKQIKVAKENPNYTSEYGVLFNKDKTKLLCCPERWSGSFEYCIQEGVKEIGERAFANCRVLCSVKCPKSLVKIGDLAFDTCTNLQKIYIPYQKEQEKIISIGRMSFHLCKKLERFELTKNIKHIGCLAFEYCKSLSIYTYESSKIIAQMSINWDKYWDSMDQYANIKHKIYYFHDDDF